MTGITYKSEKAKYESYQGSSTSGRAGLQEQHRTTPLLSLGAKYAAVEAHQGSTGNPLYPQYGLLGHIIDGTKSPEPILMNINAPNSAFLCGSQGSGKSYTLAAMLENCILADDKTGLLPMPLAGVVFHYDLGAQGQVAEVASLCSRGIRTRVLASASNIHKLNDAYGSVQGAVDHLTIEKLHLLPTQLTIERMHKLMAFSESEGSVPLYMEVIQRLLREMAVRGDRLNFLAFRSRLKKERFTDGQRTMMNMRLNLLDAFLASDKAKDVFSPVPGTLTIVDLSDPFIDQATACVLFEMCLSLFIENATLDSHPGLVVACDEAHKYLNRSAAASNFTEALVTTIRMQRHCKTRVIVATQEPTISSSLLDLCAVSVVHRFTSPAWFDTIKGHLGGASTLTTNEEERSKMFVDIMSLECGQSLVFSPTSYLTVDAQARPEKLGSKHVKMMTRRREGVDSGRSRLAADGAVDDVSESMNDVTL